MRHPRAVAIITVALTVALSTALSAQSTLKRLPLTPADVAELVVLERIEDRRDFDATALQRITSARHPELRRRAALALARLYDPRGRDLLRAMRSETDTAVLATVVWATGQLLDTASVAWLDSLLQNPRTPVGVATEAAGTFGKIRTSDTRARLATYLTIAAPGPKTAPVVGEALLSIGRHRERGNIAPIVRWGKSPDAQVRWRTAWALLRPRDPAAVPTMIELSKDPSAEVRYWALRGLSGPRTDSSTIGRMGARAVLMNALGDPDRRVQVEAVRALGTHSDAASLIQLISLLDFDDMWIATAAAEAIGSRGDNGRAAASELAKVTRANRPPWLRATALTALAEAWLPDALAPATALAKDTSLTVRMAAAEVLTKLVVGGRTGLESMRNEQDRGLRAAVNTAYLSLTDTIEDPLVRRAARQAGFASRDVAMRAAAASSMAKWADSTDIPTLLDAYAVAVKDSSPIAMAAAVETLAEIESRGGNASAAFFARNPKPVSDIAYGVAGRAFGPRTLAAWGSGRPIPTARTDADYERIVRTLIVPAYNGARPPRLQWETTRGIVETEMNALDAPLATDYLLSLVANGAMQRIRFDRVVPNFVAQQREVLIDEPLQRDEISRGRLVRGNLSWGSNIGNAERFPGTRGPGAAYDTGPAVYTFAHTPQPHNEGDFTALGMITRGLDVVDRIELGDYVKSVRVLKP